MFHSQNTAQPTEILNAFMMIFWAVIQMYIFCELGENVTERFSQIPRAIYCCDWYMYPMEIQRALPTVMVAAQQPVVFQGFSNLKCTREAFKKVKQISFFLNYIKSYVTVLRSFKEDSHTL